MLAAVVCAVIACACACARMSSGQREKRREARLRRWRDSITHGSAVVVRSPAGYSRRAVVHTRWGDRAFVFIDGNPERPLEQWKIDDLLHPQVWIDEHTTMF